MDKKEFKTMRRVEDLDVDGVADIVKKWSQEEFVEFVKERQIDGRKLLEVTEGIVKLWRPKANAIKFIVFIEDLRSNPDKYFSSSNASTMNMEDISTSNFIAETFTKITRKKDEIVDIEHEEKMNTEISNADETKNEIEAQYQTINVAQKKKTENISTTNTRTVEDILKKIVPAKSFLYRNQPLKSDKVEKPVSSYLPMKSGGKSKKFFCLSSYEYPLFDWKKFRLSKAENFNDRGYYLVKNNNKDNVSKVYRKPDSKTKYRSLSTAEELDKYAEDHFYEDLNYSETNKNDIKETSINNNTLKQVPYRVKIQELFHTLKFPFKKKSIEVLDGEKKLEDDAKQNIEKIEIDRDAHIYENSDSVVNMYDSINENKEEQKTSRTDDGIEKQQSRLPVEDYLEPVQLSKDYSDVTFRQRDDSIFGYIMSLFESKFGMKRETTDDLLEEYDPHPATPERPADSRGPMADRPLPVPVENEPYYMDIDRTEAENLLRGQPDGTFVLRPSSQPNHAYTLTVSCANAVHNVGVRRRPDGRLALGYARRGERSFPSVTSLLRHHGRRRLVLLAGGKVCGATTLNSSPEYYQTPNNLPVARSGLCT